MRRTVVALGAVAAVAAVAARATRPRLGALTYAATMAAESRLAGLRTRTAVVEGETISYYEGGRAGAPTVVLVHGFSADRSVWVRFAAQLTRDFHVVIPDLAGHGTTAYVAGAGFSAPDQARRVIGLLDVLGLDTVHLVGNSMGGFVAATATRQAPSRVRSLTLLDSAGVVSPERSAAEEMLARGHNPFLLDEPGQFPAFYAMTMAKAPFVPGFVRTAMAADYVARRDSLAEIFGDFFGRDLLDKELSDIEVPTLVMWGTEDQLVHPSAVEVWSRIPGSRTQVYDGIGHMPMVEIPKRCAADFRAFVAAL